MQLSYQNFTNGETFTNQLSNYSCVSIEGLHTMAYMTHFFTNPLAAKFDQNFERFLTSSSFEPSWLHQNLLKSRSVGLSQFLAFRPRQLFKLPFSPSPPPSFTPIVALKSILSALAQHSLSTRSALAQHSLSTRSAL